MQNTKASVAGDNSHSSWLWQVQECSVLCRRLMLHAWLVIAVTAVGSGSCKNALSSAED